MQLDLVTPLPEHPNVFGHWVCLDLLKPYDVVAWFAGHAHGNYTVQKNGVKYVTTACVSDLRGNGNAPLGYRVVRVWEDHVESTYRTIDRFGRILRVDPNADADFTGDTDRPIREAIWAAGEANMMRVGPERDRHLAGSAAPPEQALR